jgi:hypothetical protein
MRNRMLVAGNNIGGARPPTSWGEANYPYMVTGLHFNGTAGGSISAGNGLRDEAASPTSWNTSGTAPTCGNTAPTKFVNYASFAGAGYVSSPADVPNHYFDADYTVDGWFYTGIAATMPIISAREAATSGKGWSIFLTAGRTIYLQGFGAYIESAGNAWNLNAWNHFRVTRSGATSRLYVNGTKVAQGTVPLGSDVSHGTTIGFEDVGLGVHYYFTGRIDDLSIYKGVAITTADTYVVPTLPFYP